MKKVITAAMLLISLNCLSQVNLEVGVNNEGLRAGAGYVSPLTGLGLSAVHSFPLMSSEKPNTTVISVLKEFDLGYDYSLTTLAGVGFITYTQSGKYLGKENSKKPSLGLELGKQWNSGRLFISLSHSGVIYAGGGMKIFL